MCPTKTGKERSGGGPRLESFGSKIIIILNIFEGTKKQQGRCGGDNTTLKSLHFQFIEENIFEIFSTFR